MEIREITHTVEIVDKTEYVAEDGTVFYSVEDCEYYEHSALFTVNKKLKRINRIISCNEIFNGREDNKDIVEVFDIRDETDLDNLTKYIYLMLSTHGVDDYEIRQYFHSKEPEQASYILDNITYGHEVMLFWNDDFDLCWVYGDGSINGYLEFTRKRIEKAVWPDKEL